MAVDVKKLYEEIIEEFFKRLETKTSWGKEEIKKMYNQAKNDVLMRYVLPKNKES